MNTAVASTTYSAAKTSTKSPAPHSRRRIAATYFMTLDGVVQDPQWSFPYWNSEIEKFKGAELEKTDALLLGRITYEGFASAWPSRKGNDWYSTKFNTMPKYVVSSKLKEADWENSTIITGDLKHEIEKLTQGGQGDLGVHGSVTLTRWLIRNDLLDELRLLTYPITLGQGLRLFDGFPKAEFQLVESKPFSNGVVSFVYNRAHEAPL